MKKLLLSLFILAATITQAQNIRLMSGINSHHLDGKPSPYADKPISERLDILEQYGFTYDRVKFYLADPYSGILTDKTNSDRVINAYTGRKIKLFPSIQFTQRYAALKTLTSTESGAIAIVKGKSYVRSSGAWVEIAAIKANPYRDSDTQAFYNVGYKMGRTLAQTYGSQFGNRIELQNEIDAQLKVGKEWGFNRQDFDEAKTRIMAAELRGITDGYQSVKPAALTSTAGQFIFLGFPKQLAYYGYNIGFVDWHWYEDQENVTVSMATGRRYYVVPDISVRLSLDFPGLEQWYTEINSRPVSQRIRFATQTNYLFRLSDKFALNPNVKAMFIYEFLDEPQKADKNERDYGIFTWDYKPKPLAEILRDAR